MTKTLASYSLFLYLGEKWICTTWFNVRVHFCHSYLKVSKQSKIFKKWDTESQTSSEQGMFRDSPQRRTDWREKRERDGRHGGRSVRLGRRGRLRVGKLKGHLTNSRRPWHTYSGRQGCIAKTLLRQIVDDSSSDDSGVTLSNKRLPALCCWRDSKVLFNQPTLVVSTSTRLSYFPSTFLFSSRNIHLLPRLLPSFFALSLAFRKNKPHEWFVVNCCHRLLLLSRTSSQLGRHYVTWFWWGRVLGAVSAEASNTSWPEDTGSFI